MTYIKTLRYLKLIPLNYRSLTVIVPETKSLQAFPGKKFKSKMDLRFLLCAASSRNSLHVSTKHPVTRVKLSFKEIFLWLDLTNWSTVSHPSCIILIFTVHLYRGSCNSMFEPANLYDYSPLKTRVTYGLQALKITMSSLSLFQWFS